jgi:hypothetical protein
MGQASEPSQKLERGRAKGRTSEDDGGDTSLQRHHDINISSTFDLINRRLGQTMVP